VAVFTDFLRLMAEVGPQVTWVSIFIAAVVAVFVLYVGIALWVTLHAKDPRKQKISYQVFHDLLDLFRRGRRT
jgi:hypothetical protein